MPASLTASAPCNQASTASKTRPFALRNALLASVLLWALPTVSQANPSLAGPLEAGVLDEPFNPPRQSPVLTRPQAGRQPAVVQGASLVRPSASPAERLQDLRDEVQQEQITLEQLPRPTLVNRATAGERAAQVALGTDFAREAAMLSFAPPAANAALSDAARWYSAAAQRGFPGAPSLDQAGIRFYPIRVHRSN